MQGPVSFQESNRRAVPIRDLGLTITGTSLEPIIAAFESELAAVGIEKVRPRYYLSTEWGVADQSIAIGIPFYLARPELTQLHADRGCHVEGQGKDMLRYLRHEMGHVINYAYRLYDTKEWQERFGSMDRPYQEEYRPRPFSREYVHHLPGWYAQKHPDEDWSETFAVWMTPGLDWRTHYAKWPGALRKLEYCDRVMKELASRDPIATTVALDDDVANLQVSLEQYYRDAAGVMAEKPQDLEAGRLEGMLERLFLDDRTESKRSLDEVLSRPPASGMIRRLAKELPSNVFQWTGHMPERTRTLMDFLAERSDAMGLTYPPHREGQLSISLTSLVTALAMNYVQSGKYA
jgi:hypothetical protein